MIRKAFLILFSLFIILGYAFSQRTLELTRQDTLHGSVTPEREWWNLTFYNMSFSITTPGNLIDVSNGRYKGVSINPDGTKTWNWYVYNPINNYGVNINVGDYVHFGEVYDGELGKLDCD